MTYEDDAAHDERPAAGIAAAGASRADEQQLQREFGRVPNGLVMISLDTGLPNLCLAVSDAVLRADGLFATRNWTDGTSSVTSTPKTSLPSRS